MSSIVLRLKTELATQELAKKIAHYLSAPCIITLSGEIGVGKTTFIRAMLRSLGIQTPIKSPTFTLVESYPCNDFILHHFDCYRIHHEEELEYIGFREYFQQNSICCIEWPERTQTYLKNVDLSFYWTMDGLDRILKIESQTGEGNNMLELIAQVRWNV